MGLKGLQIEVEINYRLILGNNLALILSKVTMTCLEADETISSFLLVPMQDMWVCSLSLQKNRRKNRDAFTIGSTPEMQRTCKTPIQEYKK